MKFLEIKLIRNALDLYEENQRPGQVDQFVGVSSKRLQV